MRVVYIAHPLGAGPDRERNRENASRWCAWAAVVRGVSPVADWITLSGQLEETDENRERGLACDVALVARCDELWLTGGRISPGMAIEAEAAKRAGVRVCDLTDMGYSAPSLEQL